MSSRVSVILPVYNGEKYLKTALESVLNQDQPPHEVIVIDDGSKDGTPEILKRYSGRILTQRIQNAGVSRARNAALRLATGDLIAFLDHDDVWFPQKLRKQTEMLERYPEAGVCCGDYLVRNALLWGKMTDFYLTLSDFDSLNFNAPLRENALKLLLRESFVGTPSAVMLRKTLVEKVGEFNAEYKNAQDIDYWLRCAIHSSFILLSEVIMYKRTPVNQLSGDPTRNFNYQKMVYKNFLEAEKEHLRKTGLESLCRKALLERDMYLGNLYFEKGDRRAAFSNYWDGFLAAPTPKNALGFLWTVLKKGLRLLSKNTVRKEQGFHAHREHVWKAYLSRKKSHPDFKRSYDRTRVG